MFDSDWLMASGAGVLPVFLGGVLPPLRVANSSERRAPGLQQIVAGGSGPSASMATRGVEEMAPWNLESFWPLGIQKNQ